MTQRSVSKLTPLQLKTSRDEVSKAIKYFKGAPNLAEKLGICHQTIYTWKAKNGRYKDRAIAPNHARKIEQLSKGFCKKWKFRGDLWDK
jgi:hypothetical protein